MYAYEEEDDPADNYQKSVRDRANVSLNELEDVLMGTGTSPNNSVTTYAKNQLKSSVHPRTLRWYEESGRPQKYKDASNQLGNILNSQQEKQYMQKTTGPESQKTTHGPMPSVEEAAAILQTQTSYIHQLENENRYIKEELFALRAKVGELLDENRRLHDELKKSVMQEVFGVEGDFSKVDDSFLLDDERQAFQSRDIRNIQIEMERLSSIHAARTERLESQLTHSREEIQRYEQITEDLRSQLRMRDVIPTREDGMFIDTAYLSDAQKGFHKQTIDRLTKERDELMEHVTVLKGRVSEMVGREEEAYQQMKKGIELVEQAQFEQTQAMVHKEQLSEELNNMRQRFNAHINDTQVKMNEDREAVRRENNAIEEELNSKIKELNLQTAAMSTQMDKVTRDKVALINELDELKVQLRRYDKEAAMSTDTFHAESTNASLQKSQAQQEAARLRKDMDVLRRAKDQERTQLQMELDESRRRLQKAERDLVNSKEECIHHTTTSQALERELHLAKLARDSIERGRNEDLKAISHRSQHREEELNTYIDEIEDKHARTSHDMDVMIKRQNKLIGKLRDECKRQAAQIETLTRRNRTQNGNLKKQNEELRMRLDRAVTRLKDLEDTGDQHSRVHEKMKERLKMMDDHNQTQSQQVLDLIACQSKLNRDRQLLAREVEFLRRQIAQSTEEELQKYFSSNKGLVDEILTNVTSEERENNFTPKDKVTFSENIET
ncbi:serologically defined colon cancer antigen 8 homolog [Pecten maximus]|uniref:serologically defined colon cancer antigen 8 homolog n=1 Tax=Pecten maximus TaxID=6579 RepID=UPI001457FA78|nr:serologically defined colon cancer antigen 8 homolog [Pecten maximus]